MPPLRVQSLLRTFMRNPSFFYEHFTTPRLCAREPAYPISLVLRCRFLSPGLFSGSPFQCSFLYPPEGQTTKPGRAFECFRFSERSSLSLMSRSLASERDMKWCEKRESLCVRSGARAWQRWEVRKSRQDLVRSRSFDAYEASFPPFSESRMSSEGNMGATSVRLCLVLDFDSSRHVHPILVPAIPTILIRLRLFPTLQEVAPLEVRVRVTDRV